VSERQGDNPEEKREAALLVWIQQYAPYGVFTLDTSLQVQSWNRWMESHSFPAAQVVGRPLFDIFSLTDKEDCANLSHLFTAC